MVYKEATIDSIRYASINGEWVTNLKRTDADDYFPIYMNASHAGIISNELLHTQFNDPETFERFLVGENIARYNLQYLLIDEPDGNVRARLLFKNGDSIKEIECPIVGAIALAIRRNAKIFANEDSFYVSVPDPFLQSLLST